MGGLNKRDHLLKIGQDQILTKGFDLSSIKDITTAAGLPKGSFYHYFNSKDEFALEAMNEFIESFNEAIPDDQLDVSTLEKMIDLRIASIVKINFARECYISIMCHASKNRDEFFRTSVIDALEKSNEAMHQLIIALQKKKLINAGLKSNELLEFVDFAWRGARMKAKLLKSDTPLKVFKKYLIHHVLKS
ncbi:MAG: TetR/AcrR family transcriptional regulator [Cyclobacteriaceae bacterium]